MSEFAPQQPLQGELERAEAEVVRTGLDPKVWIMTEFSSQYDD